MTLTVEAGSIAGVPYGGTQFGASANAMSIIPHNVQFDFYQAAAWTLPSSAWLRPRRTAT